MFTNKAKNFYFLNGTYNLVCTDEPDLTRLGFQKDLKGIGWKADLLEF